MQIIVEKTRQMIFKPTEEYYKSNNFYDAPISSKDLAKTHDARKEQKDYFREKRCEMLPYFVTVVMDFDYYWATEQWIIDTLSGKWARKFEGKLRSTDEKPDYTNYATFWFEKVEDCIAFKLMYG